MMQKSEISKEMNLEDENEIKSTLKDQEVLPWFRPESYEQSCFFTLAEDRKLHQE